MQDVEAHAGIVLVHGGDELATALTHLRDQVVVRVSLIRFMLEHLRCTPDQAAVLFRVEHDAFATAFMGHFSQQAGVVQHRLPPIVVEPVDNALIRQVGDQA